MDTTAYLKKHGWRGKGHSLDHADRGIVKPLQISKKLDFLGVGVNKYASVSDQWWMRAYDQGLKDLGSGKETTLATAQKHGINRGGLYARFVKGEDIPGTIKEDKPRSQEPASVLQTQTTTLLRDGTQSSSRKRKLTSNATQTMPRATSDTTQPVSRDARSIKQQIRAFIDEATRQGILPAEIDPPGTNTHIPPAQHDMDAVLRLAKMNKGGANQTQLAERERLVRNLRRAALKYLESRIEVEPT